MPSVHDSDRFAEILFAAAREAGISRAIYEVRALHFASKQPFGFDGINAGWFETAAALADAARKLDARDARGVYVTLNPTQPALLARAANRIASKCKSTTSDADIVRRLWLLIDIDPTRPADVSSSDAEHDAALELTRRIYAALRAEGWPEPVVGDSGNGAHLLYRIDLENDDDARDLVQRVLRALDDRYSTEHASVDLTVYNAARISKVYGTTTRKGDAIPERPHRVARLLHVPERLEPVSLALLEALAAEVAEPAAAAPAAVARKPRDGAAPFELGEFLARHAIEIARTKRGTDGAELYILASCPFNPAHTGGCAHIRRGADGSLGYACKHNSCTGKGWAELREHLEPGYRARRAEYEARASSGAHLGAAQEAAPERESIPWPEPLAPAAYHGLAGDFVRLVEPASEADTVALLVSFLVAFGSAIGRAAHFVVEGDRHATNEFAAFVGETSKARKGTSWGRVRHFLDVVDSTWTRDRVQSGASSGEGIIWAVRDPIYRTERDKKSGQLEEVLVDAGIDDKRLLLVESELASVLRRASREGNTLTATLRDAWDRGDLASLTKNSPAKATGALVSILAHVTRDELRRELTRTEAANGFGNRFSWFCVRRSKCLPEGGSISPADLEGLAHRVRVALSSARSRGEIRRDVTARELWAKVYPSLSEGQPGLVGAMLGRAEAHAMRWALLYALLDESPAIYSEHLVAGLELVRYAEDSIRFLFGDALGDPIADEILDKLRDRADGMTRTELRDLFGRHKGSDEIGRALATLAEKGLARSTRIETGGRAAERWIYSGAATKATQATEAPWRAVLRSHLSLRSQSPAAPREVPAPLPDPDLDFDALLDAVCMESGEAS